MAHRKQTYLNGQSYFRVGKKIAGRLLDGREWNEYPKEDRHDLFFNRFHPRPARDSGGSIARAAFVGEEG